MTDDSRIDAAIDSYEMAALPKGFTRRTMKRIAVAEVEQPAFQLDFIDMVLPVFALAFLGAMIFIASYGLQSLDPNWFQGFQQAATSLMLETRQFLIIAVGAMGLVGVIVLLMGLLLITLISSRPSVRLNL